MAKERERESSVWNAGVSSRRSRPPRASVQAVDGSVPRASTVTFKDFSWERGSGVRFDRGMMNPSSHPQLVPCHHSPHGSTTVGRRQRGNTVVRVGGATSRSHLLRKGVRNVFPGIHECLPVDGEVPAFAQAVVLRSWTHWSKICRSRCLTQSALL